MIIAIAGAGGYTGRNLTDEALLRGHEVIALSRSGTADPGPGLTARAGVTARPGVTARRGSVFDPGVLESLAEDADIVALSIPAVSPSGSLAEAAPAMLATTAKHGVRLGVVGGAGSLLTSPGGPALYDTPDFPDAFRAGSKAQGAVLAALRETVEYTDWFYLSPAGQYGQRRPGERTGHFRLGDDVLITDETGASFVSGADFAIAFLDEVEHAQHTGKRFTVGY